MTIDTILDDLLRREGAPTNDRSDLGGRTAYGISERSNPAAWADGQVTEAEARAIYRSKYVAWPHFDLILDPSLQAQLVDFGVTSGPQLAIMKLQSILKVAIDGNLGPATFAAIAQVNPKELNNRLMGARLQMIGRLVQKNPSQLKFLSGWITRALEFLL